MLTNEFFEIFIHLTVIVYLKLLAPEVWGRDSVRQLKARQTEILRIGELLTDSLSSSKMSQFDSPEVEDI